LTYIALTVLGGGYVLIALLLGHGDLDGGGHAGDAHGAHDHGGSHGDGHGAAQFHFPFFSPLALATLFGSVGAWGLIAKQGLNLSDLMSLAVSIPGAFVTAYAVTYVGWRLVLSSRGSSAIRASDLEGARAEVITPIPAGGMGEVAAMVNGQRFNNAARSEDGQAVPRGVLVHIRAQVGGTLVVGREAAGKTKEG
jgi:hypothetical protein